MSDITPLIHQSAMAHAELFCWCLENLEDFQPARGEWIPEIKRLLLSGQENRKLLALAAEQLGKKRGA